MLFVFLHLLHIIFFFPSSCFSSSSSSSSSLALSLSSFLPLAPLSFSPSAHVLASCSSFSSSPLWGNARRRNYASLFSEARADKCFPFQAWRRSDYSHAWFAHCQKCLLWPNLFFFSFFSIQLQPFRSVHHLSPKLSPFY